MDENPNPKRKALNEEQTRQVAERLRTLLQSLASSFRAELAQGTQRIYIAALLPVMEYSPELVEAAIIRGVKQWRFFPSITEILDQVEQCQINPEAHDRAYRELVARYERAYLKGEARPQVKSLTDLSPDDRLRLEDQRQTIETLIHRVAQEKGIPEESTQGLSKEEFEARMRELERQKQALLLRQEPEGTA